MSVSNKIGWISVFFLAVLALSMALSAVVRADAPPVQNSLVESLISAQKQFQSRTEQSVDERELAVAIAASANGDRKGAALLLTIAIHEGGLRERVRLDQYGPHEGDAYTDVDGERKHRASGIYQVHKNAHNAAEWGSTDLGAQTRMAARLAAGALARCKRSIAPYPVSVFRGYAGRGCDMPLKGEERRAQTFARVLARLQ